jgi:hypothetical protein
MRLCLRRRFVCGSENERPKLNIGGSRDLLLDRVCVRDVLFPIRITICLQA